MRTMHSIMSFCYTCTVQNRCWIRRCLCMYMYSMCSPIYPLVCVHACHVMGVHGCFLASAKWPCAVSCPGPMWPSAPWSHVALIPRIQHGIKHPSGNKYKHIWPVRMYVDMVSVFICLLLQIYTSIHIYMCI